MADLGVDIPSDWNKIPSVNSPKLMAAEYSRAHEKKLKFIVTVYQRGIMGEQYQLQLSTIDLGPEQTQHDYLVEEYESRVEALRDMEDFLAYLSSKFNNDDIPHEYIYIEDIQKIVDEFSNNNRFLDIFELLNRISL